jgi:hypothetical protein
MLGAANELVTTWKSIDVVAEMTLVTLNVLALTIFSDGIGSDLEDFRTAMNAHHDLVAGCIVADDQRIQ